MSTKAESLTTSNRRYLDGGPCAKSSPAEQIPGSSWLPMDRPRRNLSEREREVLKLFLTGMPHAAIANVLKISASTVNGHICAIFNTTGFRRRADLAAWAARNLG